MAVHHLICQEKKEKETAQRKKSDPEAWFRGGSFDINIYTYYWFRGLARKAQKPPRRRRRTVSRTLISLLEFQVHECLPILACYGGLPSECGQYWMDTAVGWEQAAGTQGRQGSFTKQVESTSKAGRGMSAKLDQFFRVYIGISHWGQALRETHVRILKDTWTMNIFELKNMLYLLAGVEQKRQDLCSSIGRRTSVLPVWSSDIFHQCFLCSAFSI